MRFYNSYWTLAVFAALLHSNASFGQTMPLAIPNYSYTPRVEMPFMGMPMNGSHKGSQQLLASRDGSGSYQLPDGSWHKASRLVFDGIRLIVKDSTIAKQRFTSETVQQLVVKQDTFLVVRDLPGRQVAHPKPDFLHSCVNSQGVRLLALYDAGAVRPTYVLSRPHTSMQLLPAGKEAFKTAMLAIVKDSPLLREKVASGNLGRDNAVQIVQEYVASLHASPANKQ